MAKDDKAQPLRLVEVELKSWGFCVQVGQPYGVSNGKYGGNKTAVEIVRTREGVVIKNTDGTEIEYAGPVRVTRGPVCEACDKVHPGYDAVECKRRTEAAARQIRERAEKATKEADAKAALAKAEAEPVEA